MTSFRQIEANQRNASKSTGPVTETGKQRSRRNAVRHGLTAETVIGALEDAEDYKLFEVAITADFTPETAVERELVLRLASLLWRLRRATSIETGLLQSSTGDVAQSDQSTDSETVAAAVVHIGSLKCHPEPVPKSSAVLKDTAHLAHSNDNPEHAQNRPEGGMDAISDLAKGFLHLAARDNGAFERLGRYETALWRQVCQIVFMLDVLRRQSLDMKWRRRPPHPGGINPFSLSLFPRR